MYSAQNVFTEHTMLFDSHTPLLRRALTGGHGASKGLRAPVSPDSGHGSKTLIPPTVRGWNSWSLWPTGNAINDVTFVNRDVGYLAAEGALLLRTSDGGLSWSPIVTRAMSGAFTSLSFINEQVGFALISEPGKGHLLYRTDDGGQTWSERSIPSSGTHVNQVQFVNSNTGFAIGRKPGLFQTNDGGLNWFENPNLPKEADGNSLSFINANHGWVLFSGMVGLFETKNGGQTWSSIAAGLPSTRIQFIDDQRGWAIGGAGTPMMRTQDGGKTWLPVDARTSRPLRGLHIFIQNGTGRITGVAVGENGTVIKTDDGDNWELLTSSTSHSLRAVYRQQDGNKIWAVGGGGTLLFSSNTGVTIGKLNQGIVATEPNESPNLYGVTFSRNLQTAYAVGERGTILKSENGGLLWKKLIVPHTQAFIGVSSPTPDGQFVVTVGEDGMILASRDGGRTWVLSQPDPRITLTAVHFSDPGTGWALSENALLHTTNGGTTWNRYTTPGGAVLNGVHFTDAHNGWFVGNLGRIFFTDDAGFSFHEVRNVPTTMTLRSVYFQPGAMIDKRNGARGFAVGNSGTILSSDDGGRTWSEMTGDASILKPHLYSISFLPDTNVGITVGAAPLISSYAAGSIFKFDGTSWRKMRSRSSQDFFSVAYANIDLALVVGKAGTLLRTENGGED